MALPDNTRKLNRQVGRTALVGFLFYIYLMFFIRTSQRSIPQEVPVWMLNATLYNTTLLNQGGWFTTNVIAKHNIQVNRTQTVELELYIHTKQFINIRVTLTREKTQKCITYIIDAPESTQLLNLTSGRWTLRIHPITGGYYHVKITTQSH